MAAFAFPVVIAMWFVEAYEVALGRCQVESTESLSDVSLNEAFVDEFGDDIAELYEQASLAPAVVAVELEMMDCMAGLGYRYPGYQEMLDSIVLQVQALGAEVYGSDDISDDTGEPSSAPPDVNPWFTEEQNARLSEIQTEERELAAAAWECDAGQERIWRVIDQEFYQLQVDYIERNRQALDAFLLDR